MDPLVEDYYSLIDQMQFMVDSKDRIITKLEYIYEDPNTHVTIADFFKGQKGEEYSAEQIRSEISSLSRDIKVLRRKLNLFIDKEYEVDVLSEFISMKIIGDIKKFLDLSEGQVVRMEKLVR